MITEVVPSEWIAESRRLDSKPYVSGAVAAMKRLEQHKTDQLETLTSGFRGGIFTHLFSPSRVLQNPEPRGALARRGPAPPRAGVTHCGPVAGRWRFAPSGSADGIDTGRRL